jgi:succinate dehydrogenase flavin-adding protein (antitoxin of CptAB toxin-antitoxin module)
MTLTKALNILRHFQLWRLGEEITQLEPQVITQAIDTILKKHPTQMTDTILESLLTKFRQRSEVGQRKYNTTLDRKDLTLIEWLNHAQQEAMDLCLYLEKIKKELKEKQ